MSHPARGAWIEMRICTYKCRKCGSHPARGAWIEIIGVDFGGTKSAVAPRKGCVD